MKKGETIAPTDVRYIKLGRGGEYEDICLQGGSSDGVLRLGYHDFPDFGNVSADKLSAVIDKAAAKLYTDKGAAKRHANQVADFYLCDKKTLWFTFAHHCLWWCFAKTKVKYLGGDQPKGSRERETAGGWSNESIQGRPLRTDELDGRLTQTEGFRGTICKIRTPGAAEYLVQIINGKESPEVARAKKRRVAIEASITELMQKLNPKDFELLVDLVFSRSGWRRTNLIGGTQKTVDIVMELPSTGETAFVQVKTGTDTAQLKDYKEQFRDLEDAGMFNRMFYVFHTGKLPEFDDGRITVIGPKRFSGMILNAGLFDWLVKKSGF